MLAAKPDKQSLIPRTYMSEGKNLVLQDSSDLMHIHLHMCTHAHNHTRLCPYKIINEISEEFRRNAS